MSSSSYSAKFTQPQISSGASFWQKLAYRHKASEATLYLMFISGLLLWNYLEVSWQLERVMLISHIIAGFTVFPLLIGSFWASHRTLLKRSHKPFLRTTGQLVEILLVLCSVSGVYLVFYGTPGNTIGWVMENIHFYSSLLLVPMVFRHAIRWSVLKFFNRQQRSTL